MFLPYCTIIQIFLNKTVTLPKIKDGAGGAITTHYNRSMGTTQGDIVVAFSGLDDRSKFVLNLSLCDESVGVAGYTN